MTYTKNMALRISTVLFVFLAASAARAGTPRPLPAPGVHRPVTVLPSDVVCVGVDGGTRLVCHARAGRAAEMRARRDLVLSATRNQ